MDLVLAIGIQKSAEQNNKKKIFLIIGILYNVLVLGYYKYWDFMIDNLNCVFNTQFRAKDLMIPMGLSFFMFKSISFLVDVYREKIDVLNHQAESLLYLSFFPQMLSGPLSRYDDMWSDRFSKESQFDCLISGSCRFMMGFCKKILIADMLARITQEIFLMILQAYRQVWHGWEQFAILCSFFMIFQDTQIWQLG